MLIDTIYARLIDTFSCDNVITDQLLEELYSFFPQAFNEVSNLVIHSAKRLCPFASISENEATQTNITGNSSEEDSKSRSPMPTCNIYRCSSSKLYTHGRRVTSTWGCFGDLGEAKIKF